VLLPSSVYTIMPSVKNVLEIRKEGFGARSRPIGIRTVKVYDAFKRVVSESEEIWRNSGSVPPKYRRT
jgi:hypothetical protein